MYEKIVISGIAGRYPGSDSIDQLRDNLFDNKDLITEDDSRWPPGLYGLPKRHGKVSNINKFDAQFFGIHGKQVNAMDPQLRILLEKTFEAIMDSGTSIKSIMGSRIGVFIGSSVSDTSNANLSRAPDISGFALPGCDTSMFANRISFCLDLKGPSYTVNTACSSSAVALYEAVVNIRSGHCDAAIVGGVHIILNPGHSVTFNKMQMLSTDGKCKFLDESADGYVRSEACSVIFLQKSSQAKRIYATIVGVLSNTDGYKEQGITYPSSEAQSLLMKSTLKAANVDPKSLTYIEAHGTGTQVGDQCEMEAIARAYCEDRERPLLVGSVKTNLGHSEPASALTSIAKVLIAFENNSIPASIHFNKPNPNILSLSRGLIQPVIENTLLDDNSIIGINSFGFGGANVHILLKPNTKLSTEEDFNIVDNIPRIIPLFGRTEESIKFLIESIENKINIMNRGMFKLLNEISDVPGMEYRSYALAYKDHDYHILFEDKSIEKLQNKRQLWFIFSGIGSQWPGIAKGLQHLPIFMDSIYKSNEILKELGLDLIEILNDENNDIDDIINSFIAITATQIALIDLFRELNIIPDGLIGHSFGEVACGYCDGCLSREETLVSTYWRAKVVKEAVIPKGLMAAVGLSWKQCEQLCPQNVYPACHNSVDSVTISGEFEATNKFVERLKEENIFAKEVNSCGIAFHSPLIESVSQTMLELIANVIRKPDRRSQKWISSSVPESDWDSDLAKYCSADYYVNNMLSPVLFHEALQHIPHNAVIMELSPHSLLQSVIQSSLEMDIKYIPLMKRNNRSGNLQMILSSIGRLYELGFNPDIDKLYPRVTYPVSRGTPSLSPLIKWDHSDDWFVPLYPDYFNPNIDFKYKITIDLNRMEDVFYSDHCIQNQIIFPGTGYVVMVWEMLAKSVGKSINECPIKLENIKVYRATILKRHEITTFSIHLGNNNDYFIKNNNYLVFTTKAFIIKQIDNEKQITNFDENIETLNNSLVLNRNEFYKELRIRGYDYGKEFQLIEEVSADGCMSKVVFNGNWITFLDSVIQINLLSKKYRSLYMPVSIQLFQIDPTKFFGLLQQSMAKPIFVFQDKNINFISIGEGIKIRQIEMKLATVKTRPRIIEKYKFVSYFSTISNKKIDDLIELSNRLTKETIDCFAIRYDDHNTIATNIKYSTNLKKFKKLNKNYTIIELLEQNHKSKKNFLNIVKNSFSMNDIDFIVTDKIYYNEIVVRPLIDIVIENFLSRSINIVELSLCLTNSVIKAVKSMIDNLNPLLEANYKIIVTNDKQINEKVGDNIEIIDWDWKNIFSHQNCADLILFKYPVTINENMNIEKMMEHMNLICKVNGFAMLFVRNGMTSCERLIYSLMGLKCGVDDMKIDIIDVFTNHGFMVIGKRTYSKLFSIHLLRKVKIDLIDKQTIVKISFDSYEWINKLKYKLEECNAKPEKQNIWLLAKDSQYNGVIGLVNCLRKEPNGHRIRCLFIADDNQMKYSQKFYLKTLEKDLVMNVVINGELGSFRHLTCDEEIYSNMKDCSHAFINVETKGDLSSLKWFESDHKYWPIGRKSRQRLINVYYSALNFRDIMISTGKLSVNALPGDLPHQKCTLGLEFVGRDQSGRRVVGMVPAKALATTVVVNVSDFLWPIPDHWSMEEACTVPVAYCTAYYALVIRGRIRKGETVLIHSGSGAVGQAAINIALKSGCRVFTTVGNQEKKEFLAKNFPQLNANSFADSSNTSFEEHVLKETKGRGVDLVLNSLAENKLQASVRCLANHGRFLEIGKYDMSKDNPLGLSAFLKNIEFHGILLDALFEDLPRIKSDKVMINKLIADGIISGAVVPLRRTLFDINSVEKAFRYMSSGKHIGKVLIKIRDEDKGRISCEPMTVEAIATTVFIPTKTYIIIGGLGGFGLELIQWMVEKGAKKFVINSRNGMKNNFQKYCVKRFRKLNALIVINDYDLSFKCKTEKLIDLATSMGEVGGIFNMAMILNDGLFDRQSVETFERVCKPKVNITINMDEISRQKCQNLDYFVVFSSVSCGKGNAGQTNYGFANSVMERICESRRRDGLHGLAIQWGAIGDVGVVADRMGGNDIEIAGSLPQRIKSCLEVLDRFLQSPETILSSHVMAIPKERANLDKNIDLITKIYNILGIKDHSNLSPNTTLAEMGMDSLTGTEVKQILDNEGYELSKQELRSVTVKRIIEMSQTNK